MEHAGTAYHHLFRVIRNKNYYFITMLYNFWILFKLIKSLIVSVASKLWYASFPYKITTVWNFLKLMISLSAGTYFLSISTFFLTK